MKFLIRSSTDYCGGRGYREINTIDELKQFAEKEHPGWQKSGKDKDLIIHFGDGNDKQPSITIYDDWIE